MAAILNTKRRNLSPTAKKTMDATSSVSFCAGAIGISALCVAPPIRPPFAIFPAASYHVLHSFFTVAPIHSNRLKYQTLSRILISQGKINPSQWIPEQSTAKQNDFPPLTCQLNKSAGMRMQFHTCHQTAQNVAALMRAPGR